MKLHIFYRHYNIKNTDNRNRPSWFDYEKCYDNLLSTINFMKLKLRKIKNHFGKLLN